MKTMNSTKVLLTAAVAGVAGLGALALTPAPAQATFTSGIVDFQYVSGDTPNGKGGYVLGPTMTGAAVIGSSGDVWNQVVGTTGNYIPQGTNSLLLTDGVTHSGASITSPHAGYQVTGEGAYIVNYASVTPNPNANLYGSILVQYASGGYPVAVISGLDPSLTYDMYLYSAQNSNNTFDTFNLTNGTITYDSQSALWVASPGNTTLATGTITPSPGDANYTSGVNYVELAVTPDAAGQIAIAVSSDSNLSGFQLTPAVPEPTALGLLVLGGLGLLLASRRRKTA